MRVNVFLHVSHQSDMPDNSKCLKKLFLLTTLSEKGIYFYLLFGCLATWGRCL